MNDKNILIVKISLIIVFIILAIGLERIYRDPLFTKSLTWELEWQSKSSSVTTSFFKIISNFGTQPVLIPILVIIILWLPLNKSFAFLCALIYSVYFDNMLKVIYGNPRPYWVDNRLFISCDGGYGNPSGHSFSSTAVYLSLWHVITDYEFFSKSLLGKVLRVLILIFFILLTFTILISRLYLGVHSVNQVLYGLTMGFALYYIIFNIFSIHKYSGKYFFSIFTQTKYNIIFSAWYIVLIIVSLLTWGLLARDDSQWDTILLEKCSTLMPFRKFNNDALFGMLLIFGLVGAHLGLVFLAIISKSKFPDKEEEVNHWYKGSFLSNVYRILLAICFALPMILNVAVPGTLSLGIIFTFKIAVPYFDAIFNIYGPLVYCTLLLKIGNKEVLLVNAPQFDMENSGKIDNQEIRIIEVK